MKKFTALLLLLVTLLSLVSCDNEYEPVKSTAEESRIVMTAEYDGKSYDIKYELYRALFIALKYDVDGGDESVWSGTDKDKYIAEIDALIKDKLAEIYSVFHVAKKIGINIYSKEYDDTVEDIIALSVEGGFFGDTEIEGFDGDYGKYLSHLKKEGINYSVQDLLIRYYIASEQVYIHYAGNLDSEEYLDNAVKGEIEYTPEDVYEFYSSPNCVRVIRAFLPSKYFTKERAEEIRLDILEKAKKGEEDVANYIIGTSTTGASDIKNGEFIAPHNLDKYYTELTDAAFSMSVFDVSNVIEVNSGYESGYVIIYKTVKKDSHFEASYDKIVGVYLQNEVGKIIDTAATSIKAELTETDILKSIDRSAIISETK